MTPHSLAFYLDVIASGTVLGAGPTDSPDQVTAILGTDFAENTHGSGSMWRDYGMVEFFWQRESRRHPWEGHHFTVQVHRLSRGGGVVNRVLRERYGRFGRHVPFAKLERLAAARGVRLEDVPNPNTPTHTLHWQPASQVSVLTHRSPVPGIRGRGGARRGDVHALSSSMTAGQVALYTSLHGGRDARRGRPVGS
ncbi:hypothetical protein ACFPC0_25655 [Streptomyces andamanensis]|uniref:Uncharacterized protein n=1 Tax=Streptomyces andamanensis TaxID=1565035 RepID=A0ABV8TKE7_9ACTN